ncbi:MAG TPA: hypothetical protein VGK49_11325, partial [Ilumatobacteraceae bacterium]
VKVRGNAHVQGAGNVLLKAISHVQFVVSETTIAGLLGFSNASVTVDDNASVVSTAGTLDLSSSSTVDNGSGGAATVTVAGDSGSSDSSVDAAIALAIVFSDAKTEVKGSSTLSSALQMKLEADNFVDVAVSADTGTASAGAGVAIAVAVPNTVVAVTSTGSVTSTGGTISLESDADNRAVSTAVAKGGGSSGNDQSPNDRTKKSVSSNGNANTSDGSISVAAALAFTYLNADTTAGVAPSGGDVALTSTGNQQKIHAGARNRGTSNADGSAVGSNNSGGVGVGVAVTLADITNRAYIDGTVAVTASALVVESLQTNTKDEFSATAKSGVGDSGSVGVAGSLAVLVVDKLDDAVLDANAALDVNDATVSLTALSTTENKATATAATDVGGDTTGVGASVAINLVFDTTNAGLVDGAALTNPDSLTIAATTTDTMETKIKTGAEGGNAIAAGVATSFSIITTTASIGTGADVVVDGTVSATATQDATVTTLAEGAADGGDLAVGVAIALAVVEHTVESLLSRNLTSEGSTVMFRAWGNSTSTTTAKASAKGGKDEGDNGGSGDTKAKADKELTDANQRASDNTTKQSGSGETPKGSTGDSGGDSVSVAGAIAVNIASTTSQATLEAGKFVTASGLVTFASLANTDANAVADGQATGGSVGVGAAVAINFVNLLNLAGMALGGGVSSSGLSITAEMRTKGGSDNQHSLSATATSGAGSDDVGVAGALALNIVESNTKAVINNTSPRGPPAVNAHAGAVDIKATSDEKDVATAKAKATGDTGIGASVALNIIDGV